MRRLVSIALICINFAIFLYSTVDTRMCALVAMNDVNIVLIDNFTVCALY